MIRVVLKQARPGMVLARGIPDPQNPGTELLARGDSLAPETIADLHEAGVYDLWIEVAALDFFDDSVAPHFPAIRQRLGDSIKVGFLSAMQRLPAGPLPAQLRDTLRALLDKVRTCNLPCFDALAHADEHVATHGAEVAYLALVLGITLQDYVSEQRKHSGRAQPQDLLNLALGCLFHDIGNTKLDENDREFRHSEADASTAWERHAELGFNLVRGQLEPSAAAIVLHHHQHFDGTGFPATSAKPALAGAAIHVYSRIAMVADTFSHLLSHDGLPMPALHALWRLQQPTCRGWSDPVILAALMRNVTPFLPGMVVQLSDRRFAVVTRTSEATPCHPEVRTLNTAHPIAGLAAKAELLNLAGHDQISVQRVDSIDITSFIYAPPQTAIMGR